MLKKVKESNWRSIKIDAFADLRLAYAISISPYQYHVVFPECFPPVAFKSHKLCASRLATIKVSGSFDTEGTIDGLLCPDNMFLQSNTLLFAVGAGAKLNELKHRFQKDSKACEKIISCYLKLEFKRDIKYQYSVSDRIVADSNMSIIDNVPATSSYGSDFIIRADIEDQKIDTANPMGTFFHLYNVERQTVFYEFAMSFMSSSTNASHLGELQLFTKSTQFDEQNENLVKKLKFLRDSYFENRPVRRMFLLQRDDLYQLALGIKAIHAEIEHRHEPPRTVTEVQNNNGSETVESQHVSEF